MVVIWQFSTKFEIEFAFVRLLSLLIASVYHCIKIINCYWFIVLYYQKRFNACKKAYIYHYILVFV